MAEYKKATALPPLEIPPGLDRPRGDAVMEMPEVVPGEDGARGRDAPLLPRPEGAAVHGTGAWRWLEVEAPAEEVWTHLIAFWQEQGFELERQERRLGIIETGWAENRADIPEGSVRRTISKLFPKLYSAPTRDRFRVRLERGERPDTTEIHLAHYGVEEIPADADGVRTIWKSRPADPELVNEMINRVLVSFGVEEASARTMASAPERAPAAVLRADDPEGPTLELNDGIRLAWRRVGSALDRVGFVMEDRDRANGVYYIRALNPGSASAQEEKGWLGRLFDSEAEGELAPFRIVVSKAAAGARLRVLDGEGQRPPDAAALALLRQLEEQLR